MAATLRDVWAIGAPFLRVLLLVLGPPLALLRGVAGYWAELYRSGEIELYHAGSQVGLGYVPICGSLALLSAIVVALNWSRALRVRWLPAVAVTAFSLPAGRVVEEWRFEEPHLLGAAGVIVLTLLPIVTVGVALYRAGDPSTPSDHGARARLSGRAPAGRRPRSPGSSR